MEKQYLDPAFGTGPEFWKAFFDHNIYGLI